MHDALPAPNRTEFPLQEQQLGYYRGAMAGKTAAEIMVGQMLGEEHYNATHDSLTGLLNRGGLEEQLSFMDPNEWKNYAALYADADKFKAVNDMMGHKRGDEMLVEVANALHRSMRTGDILARIGGDEFIMLIYVGAESLNHPTALSAQEQAEGARNRIHSEMEDVLVRNQDVEAYGFGMSVGIAHPTADSSIESLKAEAEAEMYTIKRKRHQDLDAQMAEQKAPIESTPDRRALLDRIYAAKPAVQPRVLDKSA